MAEVLLVSTRGTSKRGGWPHRMLMGALDVNQCSLVPSKNGFAGSWIPFFHQIYFQILLFCSHVFFLFCQRKFLKFSWSSVCFFCWHETSCFNQFPHPFKNVSLKPPTISPHQASTLPSPTSRRQHAKHLLSPNAGGMSCPSPKKHRNSPHLFPDVRLGSHFSLYLPLFGINAKKRKKLRSIPIFYDLFLFSMTSIRWIRY